MDELLFARAGKASCSDFLTEMMTMFDSQKHIFTNEFDEMCIVISLEIGFTAASMQVTVLQPNSIWNERMPISMDNLPAGALDEH